MKKERAITLIALVITIMVLLILAGVTIVTLLGDNGIITKATTAKEKTQEAGAVERVQVEVVGSYKTNGNIDIEKLNQNFKNNIPGIKLNGQEISETNKIEKLPVNVKLDGYNIVINNNGNVERIPELTAKIIDNPKEYYGKKVTNYKDDENTYRIFYVDTENYFGDGANTIYLKADCSYSIQSCQTTFESNQTKVRQMNPLWAKERGNNENQWNNNEKGAAWLCDTSKWTEYCDNNKANYAIGGPSIEMYIKSYNQAFENEENIKVLGTKYSSTKNPGYMYTLNGVNKSGWTGNDTLCYSKFDSMYCGRNGSKDTDGSKGRGYWWLASPCDDEEYDVCSVNGVSAYLGNSHCGEGYDMAVSPLISLKCSFVPKIEN